MQEILKAQKNAEKFEGSEKYKRFEGSEECRKVRGLKRMQDGLRT